METINALIEKYYEEYKGLPNNKPLVRSNQMNDAFELVALEILYGKELGIDLSNRNPDTIDKLTKYIVAPPDGGIDIVVEHETPEGSQFDFVQVKNQHMSPLEIEQALDYMEKSVGKYLSSRESVNENLREVLAETNLSKEDKSNCKYILVYDGIDNFFKGQKEDKQQVITATELQTLKDASRIEIPKVPEEVFTSDSFNNYISYEQAEETAILVNIRGYDLAELAIKYSNTSLGRNILFGQNLRESLEGKKSKTYAGMEKTIREEPEKFWFYNNGITIIAEDYNLVDKAGSGEIDNIILKNFSIINGAQTTSALLFVCFVLSVIPL